jgi:hypothetical protein
LLSVAATGACAEPTPAATNTSAESVVGADLIPWPAVGAARADLTGATALAAAFVLGQAAESAEGFARSAFHKTVVHRIATGRARFAGTAGVFAFECGTNIEGEGFRNDVIAAREGIAATVEALESVTAGFAGYGFAGRSKAGVADGAFDRRANTLTVDAFSGLAGRLRVTGAAFVGGCAQTEWSLRAGRAGIGLAGIGIKGWAGNGVFLVALAIDALGPRAAEAAIGAKGGWDTGVFRTADLACATGAAAVELCAAFGWDGAAASFTGHLGRTAADAGRAATAAGLGRCAFAAAQGITAVVSGGAALDSLGCAGGRGDADTLVALAGVAGAAVSVDAAQSRIEADAVADELASGTA